MQSPHPTSSTATHGPNPVGGRDFVIGDVHGEFDTLEHALDVLEFRPARDPPLHPRRPHRPRAPQRRCARMARNREVRGKRAREPRTDDGEHPADAEAVHALEERAARTVAR